VCLTLKISELSAKRCLRILSEPFFIEGHDIYITASIGIAVYPLDGEESNTLLKYADMAMYQAKDMERNNFQFFSRDMNARIMERYASGTLP